MNFTAHGVSSFTWCASQTSPMPPSPSLPTRRKRSATTVPGFRSTSAPRSLLRFLRLRDARVVRPLAREARVVHAIRPDLLLREAERLHVDAAPVDREGVGRA